MQIFCFDMMFMRLCHERGIGPGLRVLRPGGRAVIFDTFLPEGAALSYIRRAIGSIIRSLSTDPNRRLGDVLVAEGMRLIVHNQPSLLGGQYRIVLLRKPLLDEPNRVYCHPIVTSFRVPTRHRSSKESI